MLLVWKTSFLKQVMLAIGGAATEGMGTYAAESIRWHKHTHHGNETPVKRAGVLSPAANITLQSQRAHGISCAPTTVLTRHVDQLVHTVLLLRVAQVLVGHNLHVLLERPKQQASQEAGTKRTQGTRVQDFR